MRQVHCVILVSVLLCSAGCKQEQSYAPESLTGHWEVYAAERNGRETTLLNGAVFLFGEDNKMRTNFTGQEAEGTFTLEANTILFSGDLPMHFEITALQGDSMSLKTAVQEMQFVLDLKRATTE